jgi:hypothetical protein
MGAVALVEFDNFLTLHIRGDKYTVLGEHLSRFQYTSADTTHQGSLTRHTMCSLRPISDRIPVIE